MDVKSYERKCSGDCVNPYDFKDMEQLKDEDDFCGKCGAKIKCIVMECPRCKHTSLTDTFCTKCGSILVEKNLKV